MATDKEIRATDVVDKDVATKLWLFCGKVWPHSGASRTHIVQRAFRAARASRGVVL